MTMQTIRSLTVYAAVVTIPWGAPRGASAETVAEQGTQVAAATVETRAAKLEAEAAELKGKTTRSAWYKAAQLYREAAGLRQDGDPQAVRSLLSAANLYFHAGELGSARQTMQHAGDRALEIGDVVTAAEAYADVAWLAQRERRGSVAREFADKAEKLAASPLLSNAQRQSILSRIERITVAVR